MLRYVIGFAAGAALVAAWLLYDRGQGQLPHSAGGARSVLRGKIVPGPVPSSPAPPGLLPVGGFASADDYEWAYLVGQGDTAGSIARAITGDDGRYQELLGSNPDLPKVGEPGVYSGPKTWLPAPGALSEGVPLLLPVPWSRFVDQLGEPAGSTRAFPPDPRHLSPKTSGQREIRYAPEPAALGADPAEAPYGEVVEIGSDGEPAMSASDRQAMSRWLADRAEAPKVEPTVKKEAA